MTTISQQLMEKIASQEAMMAAIQVQVAHIKTVSDENNRALRGYDNFQGLISSVALISSGMDGLKSDLAVFSASMTEINASIRDLSTTLDKDACRECNIDEVSEQMTALRRYNESYPNVLWLLKHKTKTTILVLIVGIILISGLGHIGSETAAYAVLSWLGLPRGDNCRDTNISWSEVKMTKNIGEDKVAIALGTDNEDEQVEILRAMATPPVVITIVATGLGGISISGVGNTSNREVQNILLEAIRSLVLQDARSKPE